MDRCAGREPQSHSATTGSPSGADEAIILPVLSRMKARPFVPTAWLRSREVESVFALGVCRRRRSCEVVIQPQADVRRHC